MVKVIRSPKALAAALAFSLDNTGCRAAIKVRIREAIVAALNAQLKKGDKALIGNSAYRRHLRKSKEAEGSQVFQIDAGNLAEEARFDGIVVLRAFAEAIIQAFGRRDDECPVAVVRTDRPLAPSLQPGFLELDAEHVDRLLDADAFFNSAKSIVWDIEDSFLFA